MNNVADVVYGNLIKFSFPDGTTQQGVVQATYGPDGEPAKGFMAFNPTTTKYLHWGRPPYDLAQQQGVSFEILPDEEAGFSIEKYRQKPQSWAQGLSWRVL